MMAVNSGSNWPSRGVAMARKTRGSAMLGPGPRRMRGLGKRSPSCGFISVLYSFHEQVPTKIKRERASYHFFCPLDTPGTHGSYTADWRHFVSSLGAAAPLSVMAGQAALSGAVCEGWEVHPWSEARW